jgi:hypothetical protein
MLGRGIIGIHRLLAAGGLGCLLFGSVHAQGATGKLEGRVHDEAGIPIADAQVHLVGTAFAALSDVRGYYFINNIPPGTWSVRAAFIGHRPIEVQGFRVLAGQTTTQDFTLAVAPLQLQEIEVRVAWNALVPRDEVTTKQRIDGRFAEELPVDRLQEVLALQPGVVATSETILQGGGKDVQPGISIRGGRETQNATYIDGVPVQPGYKGDRIAGAFEVGSRGASLVLGGNSIEEASVTTGAASAEFGNASAGIVSLVTRTGGPRYQGSFGFQTDEPFGVNQGPGYNRVEAGMSGPLANRLTLAASGVLEGQRSVEEGAGSREVPIFLSAGVDTTVRQLSTLEDIPTTVGDDRLTPDTTLVQVYRYAVSRGDCDQFAGAGERGMEERRDVAAVEGLRENYGVPCNGVRIPATPRSLLSMTGKLNYTYGSGSRLSLSLSQSRFQGHRYDFSMAHLARLSAGVARGFQERSRLATLTWVHNLSRTPERALALDLSLSYQQDRTLDGPLTNSSRASTRDPWGGFLLRPLGFVYDLESFPVDQRRIDRVRRNEPGIAPRHPGNESYELDDDLRNNAYGLYGLYQGFNATGRGTIWQFWETQGVAGTLSMTLYREDRYVGKSVLDWQVDRYNRLKIGAELTRYDIAHYTSFLDLDYPVNTYVEQPLRWNAFAENRLDLGDVVVVGGIRFDWYRSGAARPYATDTLGNSYPLPRIFSAPGFDPAQPAAHFVRDRAHAYISPRLQVAFPVTDHTNFRLSYAHQVQAPDLGLVLAGINGDLSKDCTCAEYGSDIDFGKTIAFEFGIRHAFSDDMVLDLAAYNRNIVADPAYRLVTRFDPVVNRTRDLRVLTNLDFGTVQGLDIRLDRRFGHFFNGTIAYAYQQARSTGSDPYSYIYYGSFISNPLTGGVRGPPEAIQPVTHSRPHAVTGAVSLTFPGTWKRGSILGAILRDVSLFSTFRYTSGTAYSRCGDGVDDINVLSGENCFHRLPEGLNTRRLPPYEEINARLTKSLTLLGLAVTGYVDVRNLLNARNVLQVFAMNGSTNNKAERRENLAADLSDLGFESMQNGALRPDGSLALDFPHEQCAGWMSRFFRSAPANCMYLIRAEQRFGDGDGIYTVEEQTRAINALYDVARGEHQHLGVGRRARLGFEVSF